jgi:polysaccharide chain length determinant protein (PEP-CTERM system associated)
MMPGRSYTPATIRWIARNRKWLLIGPGLLFGSVAMMTTYLMKDEYRAQTLILVVPQKVPEKYVGSAVAESIEQRLQSIQPQILSESRLERIITELDLYPNKRGKRGGMEEIVADMRGDINVEIIKGDLFRVTYTGSNPYKVMQVTQRLASLFVEENLKDREQIANGTNRFLESQLDNTRRALEEQERKVRQYRETHAGELPSQVGANLQVLQAASFQFQTGEETLSRDRDRRLELERTLAELNQAEQQAKDKVKEAREKKQSEAAAGSGVTLDPAAAGVTGDVPPASLPPTTDLATNMARLQLLQRQLAGLLLRLKPEHPDVIRAKRLIADTEKAIGLSQGAVTTEDGAIIDPGAAVRTARIAQVRLQIDNIDKEIGRKTAEQDKLKLQIQTLQKRVENEPTRESELISLTRDYDTSRATYQSLLARREEAGIAADLERQQVGQQFKTLDPARLPEKPSGPNRQRINMIAAGAGLALGIALTVLLEIRDQSFRNAVEIVPVLSLPVLASVPAIMTRTERVRARRLVLAVMTLFLTLLGSGGAVAYKYGIIDFNAFKFW